MMQEIFEKHQNVDYNVRFQTDFVLPGVNTTYFSLHSLRYFSSKIWNIIPDEIKNSLSLDELKIKIPQWDPSGCHCKLSRSYIQHVGYVNMSYTVFYVFVLILFIKTYLKYRLLLYGLEV